MDVKYAVLAITVLMYMAVIIFQNKKAWITLGAAVLLVVLENVYYAGRIGDVLVTPQEALLVLVNWRVLMIYLGSLILAELFIYSKMPARIADSIVCWAPSTGIAIVIILVITGIISAFVENVATVLVMAPIAFALSQKVRFPPAPFMAGLAMMSNLQGTATLVGDPPSMIFASFANFGFNDFFFYKGKLSIFFFVQAGMIAGALFFYLIFARKSKSKILIEKEPVASLVPTWLFIVMIVGLAFCSFVFNDAISLEAALFVLGLGIIGIFWFRFCRGESNKNSLALIKRLDWETIFFLIGIFIVIGALEKTGILADFTLFLSTVIQGNVLLGFAAIILISMVISGFVDNVPYIIVMLPVASRLASSFGLPPEIYLFALLIGSCMGGNLTPFGASANIVAVGLLKKEGIQLSFAGWLKIGFPFTLITLLASALCLWAVWRT